MVTRSCRMAVYMIVRVLVVFGLLFSPLQHVQAAPAVNTAMINMGMAGMDTSCDEGPDKCSCDTAQMHCAFPLSCMAKCGGMAVNHFESCSIVECAGKIAVPWQPASLVSLLIPPPRRPPRV